MTGVEYNGHRHQVREIGCSDRAELDIVAKLHIDLLGFGPMAGLGERFIRDACYVNNMRSGNLRVALYDIDGETAGFVAYTDRSISFHRASLRKHWARTSATLLLSLLERPTRIAALFRALAVLGSRRGEQHSLGEDPMGEVVCIAVQAQFLKKEYALPDGTRPSAALVSYAAQCLLDLGVDEMRMLVDADNKAVLFLYRALGARFEPYEQAGEPMVQVWFDLRQLVVSHPPRFGAARDEVAA